MFIFFCLKKSENFQHQTASIQYVNNFDSTSSGLFTPPCITTEEVFIASCHTMHLRQRAIFILACVIPHKSQKTPLTQICAAWMWGVFSLLFQRGCSVSAKSCRVWTVLLSIHEHFKTITDYGWQSKQVALKSREIAHTATRRTNI